ncbi:BTB/POZ domain-containing protein kctd3 [Cichlidogyrus casuarinus]|uniref:BTB/POZ domain-containing protein kctd3 n=1 Tax=Cichlidogyrus casuarinus TaxID=1844966 RepID=A0ABD2QD69_9PLAT
MLHVPIPNRSVSASVEPSFSAPPEDQQLASSSNPLRRIRKSFLSTETLTPRHNSTNTSRSSSIRLEEFSAGSVSRTLKKGLQKISRHTSIGSSSSKRATSTKNSSQERISNEAHDLEVATTSRDYEPSQAQIIPLAEMDPELIRPMEPSPSPPNAHFESDVPETKPVTHLVNSQHWLVVVYTDRLAAYLHVDLLGWLLVWLSPILSCAVDRVSLSVNPMSSGNPQRPSQGLTLVPNLPIPLIMAPLPQHPPSASILPANTSSNHYSVPTTGANHPYYSNQQVPGMQPGIGLQNTGQQQSFEVMIAVSCGPMVLLWTLTPKPNSGNGRQFTPASNLLLEDIDRPKLAAPDARNSWTVELVGRFNLNQRPVDHLFFVGMHMVALSRKGLVGVRHVMSGLWQVWSTVPILSYGVVDDELLLLGGADGRISSINIQKFPLRIGDNDLLVTLMYKDPLGDPVTALSIYVAPCASTFLY